MKITAWFLVVALVACTSVKSTVVVAHPTPGCVAGEAGCEQQVTQVRSGACDEQTADPGDRIVGCRDEKSMRGGVKALIVLSIIGVVVLGVVGAAAAASGSSSTSGAG